jgi:hypothetical protein
MPNVDVEEKTLSVAELEGLIRKTLILLPPCRRCGKLPRYEGRIVFTNPETGDKILTHWFFCNSCHKSMKWSREDTKGTWVPTFKRVKVYYKQWGWTEIQCNICLDKRVQNVFRGERQWAYICDKCLSGAISQQKIMLLVRIAQEFHESQYDVFQFEEWFEEMFKSLKDTPEYKGKFGDMIE